MAGIVEPFSYANGNLTTVSAGAWNFWAAGAGDAVVSSGVANVNSTTDGVERQPNTAPFAACKRKPTDRRPRPSNSTSEYSHANRRRSNGSCSPHTTAAAAPAHAARTRGDIPLDNA